MTWTKTLVDYFIEEAMLDEIDAEIIRGRARGYSRAKIGFNVNMSISAIDKRLSRLRAKYDLIRHNDMPIW